MLSTTPSWSGGRGNATGSLADLAGGTTPPSMSFADAVEQVNWGAIRVRSTDANG